MTTRQSINRFAKISLGAVVAGCFSMQVLAADEVKLAITGPFSGGSAPMGVSMRDGAKLAIQEINAAGGIDVGGKKMKITVIERDDEAKNDRGALIAQELSAMPDLSGVIGTVNTGVAVAGDKYYQDKGITKLITPAAGSLSMTQWSKAGVKDLSIFRFAADDSIQASMVVQEVFETIRQLKANGIALLLVEQFARSALEVADYAYVMERGRVAVEGTPAELSQNERMLAAYLG